MQWALEAGWTGVARNQRPFLASSPGLFFRGIFHCPLHLPQGFPDSTLETSLVNEKNNAACCSVFPPCRVGPSANPRHYGHTLITPTHMITSHRSFLRARALPAAVPCMSQALSQSTEKKGRERGKEGGGMDREEPGWKQWNPKLSKQCILNSDQFQLLLDSEHDSKESRMNGLKMFLEVPG